MPMGHKNPGTLVAEIKMHRMSHDGSFLIVEGKDDERFWTSRRHASCELVDGEGKQNVIGGVQNLNATSFSGVLGIVDSDYDTLDGTSIESNNLLATDAHDLECLLCRSSALDKVLAEYGVPSKIERFENETGADVRTGLLKRALVFGRLKWAATRCHPVIELHGLKIPRFVNEETWAVDSGDVICNKLLDSREDALALMRHIDDLPKTNPWYVVHGHDMIEILKIGLRRTLGEIRSSVGVNQIRGILRAGMSREDLQATKLWTDMRAWETANHPYMVLAN